MPTNRWSIAACQTPTLIEPPAPTTQVLGGFHTLPLCLKTCAKHNGFHATHKESRHDDFIKLCTSFGSSQQLRQASLPGHQKEDATWTDSGLHHEPGGSLYILLMECLLANHNSGQWAGLSYGGLRRGCSTPENSSSAWQPLSCAWGHTGGHEINWLRDESWGLPNRLLQCGGETPGLCGASYVWHVVHVHSLSHCLWWVLRSCTHCHHREAADLWWCSRGHLHGSRWIGPWALHICHRSLHLPQ